MSFMTRITDLEDQDICQPLWLIDFLVGYFPEMLFNSSAQYEVFNEDEDFETEDVFYGSAMMELLRHYDVSLVYRALEFVRSIDHLIREDLPSEHLSAVKNLVSRFSRFSLLVAKCDVAV